MVSRIGLPQKMALVLRRDIPGPSASALIDLLPGGCHAVDAMAESRGTVQFRSELLRLPADERLFVNAILRS